MNVLLQRLATSRFQQQGANPTGAFQGLRSARQEGHSREAMFATADSNGDGVVTQDERAAIRPQGLPTPPPELQAMIQERVASFGVDISDGITLEELQQLPPPPFLQQGSPFTQGGFEQTGLAKAGPLSLGQGGFNTGGTSIFSQFPPSREAMFATADANADGVVTQDERAAIRPQGLPTPPPEFQAMIQERVASFGVDISDGITLEEFQQLPPPPFLQQGGPFTQGGFSQGFDPSILGLTG